MKACSEGMYIRASYRTSERQGESGVRTSHGNCVTDERRMRCGREERCAVSGSTVGPVGVGGAELTTEGLLDWSRVCDVERRWIKTEL